MTRTAVVMASAWSVLASAQAPPDLSGTWKLDAEKSRVVEAAGLAGLIGAGAPPTLHVTQPANGTLLVESQINESHARLYRPGAKVSTPVTVGPAGSLTTSARWEGRALVSEGTREFSTAGMAPLQIKEAFSLSSDGKTLIVEVTSVTAGATSASRLVYTRIADVGPCKTWPTPCKTPPSPAPAAPR